MKESVKREVPARKAYITVMHGLRGYFACYVWWNPDMGGFYEPYQTGIGSYDSRKKAEQEAKSWADDEELEYVP